ECSNKCLDVEGPLAGGANQEWHEDLAAGTPIVEGLLIIRQGPQAGKGFIFKKGGPVNFLPGCVDWLFALPLLCPQLVSTYLKARKDGQSAAHPLRQAGEPTEVRCRVVGWVAQAEYRDADAYKEHLTGVIV